MSGRVDEKFIFGEEADINDPLTNKLKQAATQDTPDKSTTVPGTADRRSYSPVENSLPFELRVLDTALEEACRCDIRPYISPDTGTWVLRLMYCHGALSFSNMNLNWFERSTKRV